MRVEFLGPADCAHAGIGHHAVEAAELRHAVGDGRAHAECVTHVDRTGRDPSASLDHQSCRLLEILEGGRLVVEAIDGSADVGRDDVGTLLGESDAVVATLFTGGPSHEDNPTCVSAVPVGLQHQIPLHCTAAPHLTIPMPGVRAS